MKVMMKLFDAAWFYVEKREAPAHFGPLIIMTPPESAPTSFVYDFVEQWRTCKTYAPPFNYRLSRSRIPSWDVLPPEEIDLDYHLRHSALPKPGGERELGVLISRLHSHRLDRRRPLWECHVIEGLAGNRFAIYMKLHHGQLDGMGSVRLMDRTFSTRPDAIKLLPPWCIGMRGGDKPKLESPKPGRRRRQPLMETLGALPQMAKTLGRMIGDSRSDQHPEVKLPFQAPMTLINGRISGQRRYATQNYELARVKRLTRAAGVKLNDVFLTLCGAALRRYLLELDALPRQSLITQVPVNVRPAGDASVGNALAFIYVTLATDVADPIDRLHAVHASAESGKAFHESLPPAGVDPFTMLLSGPFIGQVVSGLGGRTPPAANLVISNITGPKERLYFNGARVEQIYGPSVLFHGQALNITMSSYVDEINIGFTGCRDSLPSMQKLAVYTGEALEELEATLKVDAKSRN